MGGWTSGELDRIGAAEELEIASVRRDGTLSKRVTIWIVRSGDDLYVRSYKGRAGAWFRIAQARHEGQIRAGGVERDVTLVEETDAGINNQVDAEYRTKNGRYSSEYLDPMVADEARATTMKLIPR